MINIWKKKSIFFDLPYCSRLEVRHFIDVIHVEKNVCDSLIGTLLNINEKTKDDLNARLDFIEMNIRDELTPIEMGKHTYLPSACYTMSKDEKKIKFLLMSKGCESATRTFLKCEEPSVNARFEVNWVEVS